MPLETVAIERVNKEEKQRLERIENLKRQLEQLQSRLEKLETTKHEIFIELKSILVKEERLKRQPLKK
jgi:chromosome segregation ATPase